MFSPTSPSLPKHLALAAILSITIGGAATARTVPVAGRFVGEGKAVTHPTGSVTGSLDTASDALSYTITYDGLSGPVAAAHFHGPAKRGVDAGVLKPIDGPYDSPIKGQVTLDRAQTSELEHGLVYVNLHTAANPDGEARAQLHVRRAK
jgi:hypothetical protein